MTCMKIEAARKPTRCADDDGPGRLGARASRKGGWVRYSRLGASVGVVHQAIIVTSLVDVF